MASVTLPPPVAGAKSTYLKLRDRASFEFALASAAVVATVKNGTMQRVRVAMGGVATKPWRNLDVEAALEGQSVTQERFAEAARILLGDAKPQSGNGFKVELAKRCLVHALRVAMAVV